MSEHAPTESAPANRRAESTAGAAIAKKVWRKGWRREAAATQAASAAISGAIGWFDEHGFAEFAEEIRRSAMQLGVRKAEAQFTRQVAAWLKRPGRHRYPHA